MPRRPKGQRRCRQLISRKRQQIRSTSEMFLEQGCVAIPCSAHAVLRNTCASATRSSAAGYPYTNPDDYHSCCAVRTDGKAFPTLGWLLGSKRAGDHVRKQQANGCQTKLLTGGAGSLAWR